jgi:1-aminocyclopropane-1-carboxylate deaminase/D-cysteine desulfhydrase-like pyridoxal-dependent ACC family enzyme
MHPIELALRKHPKVPLMDGPTPLQRLDHLSAALDLNIYLKRDDLTPLALGGDKPRKLEYELARAQAAGADMLVTCGSAQSNHARLTTAAARRAGLDCAVVLSQDEWQALQGNLLTVYLMGADVHLVPTADHWDLEQHVFELIDTLKAQGRRPHYIPISGTTPHSCLGYIDGALETLGQLSEQRVGLDAIYTPFGTGGIFSAMLMTFRAHGIAAPFHGISVNRPKSTCLENLDHWWAALSDLLDRAPDEPRGEHQIFDEFIGREYGDPTEAGLDAILMLAESEGILLDPVYSAKMFSGFFQHCQDGRWASGQTVLLLHSGGVPALFAYHAPIARHLKKQGRLSEF